MYYQTIMTRINHPDLGQIETYGIKATSPDGTARTVPDVSTEREAVEALVARCNQGCLALCHLQDVIEDFLL